jgi:hypothetical protein
MASALDPSASLAPIRAQSAVSPPNSPMALMASLPESGSTPSAETRPGHLARLIRNPKREQGLPPYALADRDGAVQRYVEPVEGINLDRFVDQVVIVRHDTGRTLLASQLELPWEGPFVAGDSGAIGGGYPATARSDRAVEPAQFVQHADFRQAEPDIADAVESLTSEEIPTPRSNGTTLPRPRSGNRVYSEAPSAGHGDLYEPYQESYQEPYHEPYYDACPTCDDGYCDGGIYCQQGSGNYNHRDPGLLAPCFGAGCRPTGCGPGARGAFYVHGEYLMWWFDGMHTPPLVVAGEVVEGGVPDFAGDDSLIADELLFGGSEILDDVRHGARITLGWFLDPCGINAIEGDYLTFGNTSTGFFVEGDPIVPNAMGLVDPGQRGIGRPFFRVPQGTFDDDNDPMTPEVPESVNAFEDVVFTNIGGSVAVDISSRYETAGLRWRHNICCVESCPPPSCGDCCGTVGCGSGCSGGCCQRPGFGTRRIDMTLGVRYANLEERLLITEELEDIMGNQFLVSDSFGTDNDFYGGEIGFDWEWEYRRWKVDLLSRLAIGNVRQRVVVDGSTVIIPSGGAAQEFQGGLLALNSNIGSQERDRLAVMPELGVSLGYQLTCRLSFTVGYSFTYWSSVVRPGDQIDLDVNPALIPIDTGTSPTAGPMDRPRALFEQTDFFAHGLNLGLEYRL